MLECAHKTDGHPGVETTLWFFQKYFFAKSSDASLKKILSKIIAECPCTKAKANTAADRGEVRNLPILNQMNSILYVDFMELPKFAGHDFALLVTDGLSRYSPVFPLTKKVDGEGVLKEIFEGWVQVYGLPKIIHSDQDIRFTSSTGWYRSFMRAMFFFFFFLKNKCLWLKYPLWFRKKPQDLNSHPQVAIQAHKKQCNAITESWISGVPNSTRFGLN